MRLLRTTLGAALCAAALAAAAPGAAQEEGPQATVTGYAEWAERALEAPPAGVELFPALEERLRELVAQRRQEIGDDLPSLEHDPDLARAARAHAIDMLVREYIGHVGPDGRQPDERVGILARRFVGLSGENVGDLVGRDLAELQGEVESTAARLVDGFLDSPDHRENLLSPDYTLHAIGAAVHGVRLAVVHLFGQPLARVAAALPLTASPGERLPLRFDEGPGLAVPERYAYVDPERAEQEVAPLELAADEVTVAPGTWRLQFFFPREDQPRVYRIAPGPLLVVE